MPGTAQIQTASETKLQREGSVDIRSRLDHAKVDRFCTALAVAIIRSKLAYPISRLNLPTLSRLAAVGGSVLARIAPDIKQQMCASIRVSMPKLTPLEVEKIAQDSLSNLILNSVIRMTLNYLPSSRFLSMFDTREFDRFAELARTRMVVVVLSHFNSIAAFSLMSDLLRRAGVRGCGTFRMPPEFPETFKRRYRRRFFDYHEAWIDLNQDGKGASRRMIEYVGKAAGAVVIFGDYRHEPTPDDVPYRVGNATFMANRGLKLMLESARDEAIVVPCTLLYEAGGFRLRCAPAVTRNEAMHSYYDSTIGESVMSAPGQWLLWYWADKLME